LEMTNRYVYFAAQELAVIQERVSPMDKLDIKPRKVPKATEPDVTLFRHSYLTMMDISAHDASNQPVAQERVVPMDRLDFKPISLS
jgi:hypothetical protein